MKDRDIRLLTDLIDEYGRDAILDRLGKSLDGPACISKLLGYRPCLDQSLDPEGSNDPLAKYIYHIRSLWIINNYKFPIQWYVPKEAREIIILKGHGIKVSFRYFLVCNNHPGLDEIFHGTPWEGGLWRDALLTIPYARTVGPRKFSGSNTTKQRSIMIPIDYAEQFIMGEYQPLTKAVEKYRCFRPGID